VTFEEQRSLDGLAREFAGKLTELTRGVLGKDSPRFHAVNMGKHVRVAAISDDEKYVPIPVKINDEVRLHLLVEHFCCWDGKTEFLATDKSLVKLHYAGVPEPLLRWEYVRTWQNPPGAHVQVHAHRDEMAYLLRLAENGRPRAGLRRDRMPRLSEMHVPVGGHRMRPCLEDVLLFLYREFHIDTEPGWRDVVAKHLAEWRLVQLKSAVRDAPEAAVEVLRDLGYEIVGPKVVTPRPDPDKVKLFWP